MLDKEKIKNSLLVSDIEKILLSLGSREPGKDRDENLIFSTVCHGGNKNKLYYYQDTMLFHCYTDCSDSMDVYELVIRSKKNQGYNYSFYDAVRYVSDVTGKHFYNGVLGRFGRDETDEKSDRISDWDWLSRFKKRDKVNIEMPSYDEKVLDVFLPYGYEPWEEEGISLETQRLFGIKYYCKNESIIIPHYDIYNNLIGIRQRNTREEDLSNGRKYTPVVIENKMYNHPLGMNLYGLNITKNTVKKIRKILLFEGEKSCMKATDLYGDLNFTCAVSSSNITNFQRDIILSLEPEELFIAFDKYSEEDNEEDIQRYKKKLLDFAMKFTPFMRTYIIWDDNDLLDFKDSPIDKGKQTFEKLLKQKYEINTFSS